MNPDYTRAHTAPQTPLPGCWTAISRVASGSDRKCVHAGRSARRPPPRVPASNFKSGVRPRDSPATANQPAAKKRNAPTQNDPANWAPAGGAISLGWGTVRAVGGAQRITRPGSARVTQTDPANRAPAGGATSL